MAKFKSNKKGKKDSNDGPMKKKFKGPKNNQKFNKTNSNNKKKVKKNVKNGAKNKNAAKTKNTPKNENTPQNQNLSKNQDSFANKDDKVKTPKFEKSNVNGKSNFNKPKPARVSLQGRPNIDLKKYKQSENLKEVTTGEKPNWSEYKKQNKELRDKRRERKLGDIYTASIEAKKLGEMMRRTNLAPEAAEKLTKQFHDLEQGNYGKMVFQHDLSRVIQWHIKLSSPDIQLAIVTELKPLLKEMFQSKYARNVIRSLMKVGSDSVKRCILQSCYGDVVKLLSSVLPASIFEKIYVEVASKAEKNLFKQEFYGEIYKKSKDQNIKSLTDVYKESESMKKATLSAVQSNLVKILNKNLINSTLVHTVLYEYLCNCSKDDQTEMLALVRPLIAELSQTKDGAKVGNMCIWYGTNKDRKHIMKTLKEHVTKIMTSEHGYLMILGLLDTVDDTVLLKKILLQEVLNNLNEIVVNEYGRQVILYLVARRDTRYFHPSLIEYLKLGDGNESSKKPAEVREKELLDNVIDNILQNLAADVKTWLPDGPMQLVTLAVLKASSGDKPKAAYEAVAQFICDPNSKIKKDDKTFEAIEDAGLHMVLKKLIQMDAKRNENNELTFGQVLVGYLTKDVIEHWLNFNRGCFLLVLLMENEAGVVLDELKSKLSKHKEIGSKKAKGASILLKKLQAK